MLKYLILLVIKVDYNNRVSTYKVGTAVRMQNVLFRKKISKCFFSYTPYLTWHFYLVLKTLAEKL